MVLNICLFSAAFIVFCLFFPIIFIFITDNILAYRRRAWYKKAQVKSDNNFKKYKIFEI